MGHEVLAGGDHGNLQRALHLALEDLDVVVQLGQAAQHVAGGGEHGLARRGGKDLLAHLLQQGRAGLILETLDLDGDRRLGEMHLLGGPGVAAVPDHRFEQAQLLKGQVHGKSVIYICIC